MQPARQPATTDDPAGQLEYLPTGGHDAFDRYLDTERACLADPEAAGTSVPFPWRSSNTENVPADDTSLLFQQQRPTFAKNRSYTPMHLIGSINA